MAVTLKAEMDEIVKETLSGQAHIKAWGVMVSTLDECYPGWCADTTKSPVENAVEAIKYLAGR